MKANQPVLHGLHHVTAITSNAQANLDFYTRTLGLRLVKKTVNQDDVSAYHLFYADAIGSAGSDLTFFDWPQVPTVRHGAGTVVETGLRVLGGEASLEHWLKWFDQQQVRHGSIESVSGRPTLAFQDGEGQHLRLIAESYGGGPVGVETLSAALSESRDSLEDVIEPYLLQQGLIQRTPRGRMLAQAAWRHLGLDAPRGQVDLFG